MSSNPFENLQPRLSALTEGASGGTLRAQQALMTYLFSASQAQFGFNRGLAGDLTEAFSNGAAANPIAAMRNLVTRWHDRSEQALTEFRRLNDELRQSLYEAVEKPLEKASEAGASPAVKEESASPARVMATAKAR